jgi:DNA-binding LacI/PurR family transcriptional regulator
MIRERPPVPGAAPACASDDAAADPATADTPLHQPTLRSIAQAAGVSAITVSRALRNDRRVAPETLARVLAIAREVAYRPDPHIGQLMHYLRRRHRPAFQATLCALTDVPAGARLPYTELILAGARERAESRGYAFSVLDLGQRGGSPGSLQRILLGRGIEGLILLPMAEPGDVAPLLEWERFSTVATTTSVLAPQTHSAVPHHFKNIQLLCEQLTARGYRRIGLVLHRDYVARVHHAFNAGALWHAAWHGTAPVRPLIYSDAEPRALEAWFADERPDVIVTNTARLAATFEPRLRRCAREPIGFALTNIVTRDDGFAGVDERPSAIGAAAIDLLAGMVQRGERGVPDVPTSTLIPGQWVDAASCPTRNPDSVLSPARACPSDLIRFERPGPPRT